MKLLIALVLSINIVGGTATISDRTIKTKMIQSEKCPPNDSVSFQFLSFGPNARSLMIFWCENQKGANYEINSDSPDRSYDEV